MANPWFRFKQFTIHQDRCAMKVGTDGVLLGALAEVPGEGNFLDIGTGTGLIALMLAQRSSRGRIDALELEEGAAAQAAENVRNSPWPERIRVLRQDFLDFYQQCRLQYELITCNPPYFSASLKSGKPERDLARHGSDSFYRELLKGSARLLKPSATCWLIVPAAFAAKMEGWAADYGLGVTRRIEIRSRQGGQAIRTVLALKPGFPEETLEEQLVLYNGPGDGAAAYTPAFRELVRPFYLYV